MIIFESAKIFDRFFQSLSFISSNFLVKHLPSLVYLQNAIKPARYTIPIKLGKKLSLSLNIIMQGNATTTPIMIVAIV
jgi:hypothetical protein